MSEPGLADKVVLVHERLGAAAIPHAFGGALALAYYAEPRATIDIDVNVFVPATRYGDVASALHDLGVESDIPVGEVERDGQVRMWWGRTPIDVFFAYDRVHDDMRDAAVEEAFGATTIPILGAADLMLCKAVFDRPKDWIDIEQMLVGGAEIDVDRVRRSLERVVGADDDRVRRLDETLQRVRISGG